jgi:ubiquinone/menaquinone biosynthesis C-methylase UbiE
MIDYFLDEGCEKVTKLPSSYSTSKPQEQTQLRYANSEAATTGRTLPFLSFANGDNQVLKAEKTSVLETTTISSASNSKSKIPTSMGNNPQNIRQTLYEKSLGIGKRLFGGKNPAKDFGETLIRAVKPEVLLEVGANRDGFSYDVSSECQLVIRSDILKPDLIIGKTNAAQENRDFAVQNLACDGTELPIGSGSVSAAVSINVLHHLEQGNHEELMSEIKRVLKGGGYYLGIEILQPHRDFRGCMTHVGLHHIIRGERHPPFLDLADILSLITTRNLQTMYADVYVTWRGDYACVLAKKGVAS